MNFNVIVSFTVPQANPDTLIGAFNYKKVFVTSLGSGFGNGYLGCYRSLSNGITYYIPKDSVQEFVLMDLSAQTGDTVFNVYYHNQNISVPLIGDFKVGGSWFTTVGSFNLKNLLLVDISTGYFTINWIEKIGGRNGLNNQVDDPWNLWQTYCMSAHDTTWVNNYNLVMYPNQTCQLDLGMNDHNSFSQIAVSPNPFTNQISISNYQSGSQLFLYDIFGRLIFTSIISSNGSVEFSSSLIDGIYFLEIKDVKGKRIGVEKVVKDKQI